MTAPFGRRIVTLFPHYNTGGANSHTVAGILTGMARNGADVSLWVPASDRAARLPFTRDALPRPLARVAYRAAGVPAVDRFAERRFLRAVRPGDIAYVWPGATLDLYRAVKDRGAVLVVERINCHTATAKAILDREAARLGCPPDHAVTEDLIARERAELELADFVFSPSPMVDESLRANGVPAAKILPCSYGWAPERIGQDAAPGRAAGGEPKFIFVGLACQRKGIDRLLDAWIEAAVPGTLLLAGRVADDVVARRAADLARPTVRRLGHVADIGSVYRSADVFVFPSLEDGGPLVTYEAMACGLPAIVSPMGAGRVTPDGVGSVVLPPENTADWAAAFRRLAANPGLREEMGRAAAARAAEFTWTRCGAVRLARLGEALSQQSAVAG